MPETYVPLQEWMCVICGKFGLLEKYEDPDLLEAALRFADAHLEASPQCQRMWGIGGLRVKDADPMTAIEVEPEPEPEKLTGLRPVSQWGNACQRGFVRDSRFGPGQVIKGTNRAVSRKWRKLDSSKPRGAVT